MAQRQPFGDGIPAAPASSEDHARNARSVVGTRGACGGRLEEDAPERSSRGLVQRRVMWWQGGVGSLLQPMCSQDGGRDRISAGSAALAKPLNARQNMAERLRGIRRTGLQLT